MDPRTGKLDWVTIRRPCGDLEPPGGLSAGRTVAPPHGLRPEPTLHSVWGEGQGSHYRRQAPVLRIAHGLADQTCYAASIMHELRIAVRRTVNVGLYFIALGLGVAIYIALKRGVRSLFSPDIQVLLPPFLCIMVGVPLLAGVLTFIEHRRKRL